MALQQKSAREAEQERQWKQLQALRQQQAQQQQHVIHEQRVQGTLNVHNEQIENLIKDFSAISRVQRQISTGDPINQQFISPTDQQSPLQVSTNQELSPAASPSPGSRQFLGLKSPTFPHSQNLRPQTPAQSPHEFQQPATPDTGDIYQPPATPKPTFQPRIPSDPFGQQPATPRPTFGVNRPTLQVGLKIALIIVLSRIY